MLGAKMSVRMTAVEGAWLDAVAEVLGVSRAEVVRQALSRFCVRETARIERTRHYAIIGYLARQEDWNPVDDHLGAVGLPEDREVPEAVQSAYKRITAASQPRERALGGDYLYVGSERRERPRDVLPWEGPGGAARQP